MRLKPAACDVIQNEAFISNAPNIASNLYIMCLSLLVDIAHFKLHLRYKLYIKVNYPLQEAVGMAG